MTLTLAQINSLKEELARRAASGDPGSKSTHIPKIAMDVETNKSDILTKTDLFKVPKAPLAMVWPKTTYNERCWTLAQTVLMAGTPKLILTGPPSTGKTTLPFTYAKIRGVDVYSITLHDESSPSELWGHWVVKGGDMVWHYGVGSMWWKTENSVLVINEIDKSSPQVLTALYALLDDPFMAKVTLYNNETISPCGGQICVATTNGTQFDLPEALQSRFPVAIEINRVNPGAIDALPHDLRAVAKESVVTADIKRRVSLRHFNAFAELRKTISEVDAAEVVFGVRASDLLASLKVGAL